MTPVNTGIKDKFIPCKKKLRIARVSGLYYELRAYQRYIRYRAGAYAQGYYKVAAQVSCILPPAHRSVETD